MANMIKISKEEIKSLSLIASRIVREHFDPLVGTEQNEYMISKFQSPEVIEIYRHLGFEKI